MEELGLLAPYWQRGGRRALGAALGAPGLLFSTHGHGRCLVGQGEIIPGSGVTSACHVSYSYSLLAAMASERRVATAMAVGRRDGVLVKKEVELRWCGNRENGECEISEVK